MGRSAEGGDDKFSLMAMMEDRKKGARPIIPDAPKEANDFIAKCLIVDPRERWTVPKLLVLSFIIELNCNVFLCKQKGT